MSQVENALLSVKSDFPLLLNREQQPAFHYLDSAATTQKPEPVIEAIANSYRHSCAPIHRGFYSLAEQASNLYEQARATVAQFVGAPSSELIFTRSATESINMVAQGWAKPRLQPGDRVWVSRMEHHANFLPWQRVCAETGAELCIIDLLDDGSLDLSRAEEIFSNRTRLIALCQVSNVLGVENPIAKIAEKAREKEIAVLVDATQSVGHMSVDVDVEELDCDFMVFSAHKMYGPGGIGALYAKSARLDEMEPMLLGGGMVDVVDLENMNIWVDGPARFEAGSPNLAGAMGFAAAVDYLSTLGMGVVQLHVSSLRNMALQQLTAIEQVQVLAANTSVHSSILSFVIKGLHPHDIAQVAGDMGVAVRAGHHCAQPLMDYLGIGSTLRASFGVYSDEADVEALVRVVHRATEIFL